jgi:hypothetical protein
MKTIINNPSFDSTFHDLPKGTYALEFWNNGRSKEMMAFDREALRVRLPPQTTMIVVQIRRLNSRATA